MKALARATRRTELLEELLEWQHLKQAQLELQLNPLWPMPPLEVELPEQLTPEQLRPSPMLTVPPPQVSPVRVSRPPQHPLDLSSRELTVDPEETPPPAELQIAQLIGLQPPQT